MNLSFHAQLAEPIRYTRVTFRGGKELLAIEYLVAAYNRVHDVRKRLPRKFKKRWRALLRDR